MRSCGALNAIPNQSLIYRTVTQPYIRYFSWPEEYQQEAAMFTATPGVSAAWIVKNLGMDHHQTKNIQTAWPEWAAKGLENAISATYDEARRYVERAPKHSAVPTWAYLYAMADKKAGMSSKEFLRVWGDLRPRKNRILI